MNDRPPITISSRDLARLEQILEDLPDNAFPGKSDLEAELSRADVVAPEALPGNVVSMNSRVRFKVQGSSERFEMKLVYPKDMDSAGGTVSIFAPVGSAIIGLAEGDTIRWPRAGGSLLEVTIEEVLQQPEREGRFDL